MVKFDMLRTEFFTIAALFIASAPPLPHARTHTLCWVLKKLWFFSWNAVSHCGSTRTRYRRGSSDRVM